MLTRDLYSLYSTLVAPWSNSLGSMAKAPVPAGTPEMGPAILASGYLAKRTRAMGRWKKRWWQLTDDGTLLYFKSEERTKALGEIDVARSCYDVRLGAEQCKVEFPRAVPSCCCFSFSVLKRTYYLYAATAADAKRWAESIVNVSVVLNYRKKGSYRPLPPRPGVDNTAAVRGRVYRRSDYSNRTSDTSATAASEATDQPTELPRIINKHSRQNAAYRRGGSSSNNRYGSVPNLHRPRGRYIPQSANARLWLDGSPPPNGRGGRRRNTEREPHARPSSAMATHKMNSCYSSIDRLHLTQPTNRSRVNRAGQRQLRTGDWWRQVDADGYELPPRAQSVDISILSKKRARFSTHTQQMTAPVLPYLARDSKTVSPPPVKPKPILKKMRPVLTLDRDISEERESVDTDLMSAHSPTPVPTDQGIKPPAIPPKRCSLKVSVNSKSGQRDVYLPLPPNFKPPPPPELHSGSSSPKTVTPSGSMITQAPSYCSSQTSSLQEVTPETSYNHLQQVHRYTCIVLFSLF